jgi:beta-phosphoglucomutase
MEQGMGMTGEGKLRAVIFDLDGVIVSTDEFHYRAWQKLADEEGIYFDRTINERLRGVSRMESLAILLESAVRDYTEGEKLVLAARKNGYYRQFLDTAVSSADILPGVMPFLEACKAAGIKIAVGSSSRNSPTILERIGLTDYFDATADGNDIANSKPHPEVFLLAAERLGVPPGECMVVEDAEAGVAAAVAAGMKCLAVGSAAGDPRAALSAASLETVRWQRCQGLFE